MELEITSQWLSTSQEDIVYINLGDHIAEVRTSTINYTDVTDLYQQLISDRLMRYLEIYVNLLICGALALFGTVSNIINMVVFYGLGLKDSMSVGLFGLSLADLLLSLVNLTTRMFPIWTMFFDTPEIDVFSLGNVGPGWMVENLFLCSGCITTFLSVERCVCVILPFKVKQIFTRNRAIVIVSAIFVVNIAACVPIYSTVWLQWIDVENEAAINETSFSRLVALLSDSRPEVENYVEIFNATVIPIPLMTLLLGSAIWMAISLQRSIQLRMTMIVNVNDDRQKEDSKTAYKTRRLVKVILFIAITYMITSIPRFYAISLSLLFPEVNLSGKEQHLSLLHWHIALLASTINGCVNIFVYLKINSSYKKKFQELFKIKH